MLCYEREAGTEALSKLNLIIKQLYKICELDLLSKGEVLGRKLFESKNFGHNNCFFTFFASDISF